MRVRIYPYSSRSLSARSVARGVDGLVIKREGSSYVPRASDIVINWGAARVPSRYPVTFNKPEAVAVCCSKTRTYQALQAAGVPTLDWTTSPDVASRWLTSGYVVYHRATDHGSRGRGITVLQPYTTIHESLRNVGFFTKGVSNAREFRVYVVRDTVTTILEKRRRNGVAANPHVRSYQNGYVFCRNHRGPIPRETITQTGIKALKALGLDFGGIDLLLKEDDSVVVLEVNSAPGIEGTALREMCDAFTTVINNEYA